MSEEKQEEINLAEVATAEQANVAINEAQEDITEIGDNDVLITPNVDLPTRDDMTIARVMQVLKQNFDNFSFDVNEDYAKKFSNLDDLISYTDRSFGDICKEREKTECFVRNRDGAAMARFWCTCKVLSDVALSGKKYGDQAVKQYAATEVYPTPTFTSRSISHGVLTSWMCSCSVLVVSGLCTCASWQASRMTSRDRSSSTASWSGIPVP